MEQSIDISASQPAKFAAVPCGSRMEGRPTMHRLLGIIVWAVPVTGTVTKWYPDNSTDS